jgi:hypothetical protein
MIKVIEPLGKHDRAAFSCGVAALDDWFRFRAGQRHWFDLAGVIAAGCNPHGLQQTGNPIRVDVR